MNNNITNNTSKETLYFNNEHVLNIKTYCSSKAIPATTINHRLLVLKIIYIKGLIIEHSITQVTYLNI